MRVKTILSIPTLLVVLFLVAMMIYPPFFSWLLTYPISYITAVLSMMEMTALQIIFLIYKLYAIPNVNAEKKSEWKWLLIFYNSFAAFVFIWKTYDELVNSNKDKPTKQHVIQ